jgi:hypothetical protein
MTDPVHTGHGQEEYFDEALAEFYAKVREGSPQYVVSYDRIMK